MSATNLSRRKSSYPDSLADLHRFRKTIHGHDGSSRIVMVRKTDQRTFASVSNGQIPTLETITRETVETFRGQRTECKITTEKKDSQIVNLSNFDCANKKLSLTKSSIDNNNSNKILSYKYKNNASIKKTKNDSLMTFCNECLKAHNEYRQLHGIPPLKLDKQICRISQEWANYLINKVNLQHSNNKDYGENLFCMTFSSNSQMNISAKDVVENWYSEIKNHTTYGREPNNLVSGHFTQVIWKETEKLGVGLAKTVGKFIVVANYYPAGNIIGRFSDNVFPINGNRVDIDDKAIIDLQLEKISALTLSKSIKQKKNFTEKNFLWNFLKAHNDYRKKHGVKNLEINLELCKYSEEWAKHLASKNILEHRPVCNYGENIYCMYSSDPNFILYGHMPVDTWYKEIQYYTFDKEPHNLKSGHFTQIIWKSSKSLGVGVAKNNQGKIYVVANYSPAGNFVGHYIENISAPIKYSSNDKKFAFIDDDNELLSCNSQYLKQFTLEGLKIHNEYRRRHGVPDLKLNQQMCCYVQEWADTCAKNGSLCHRANNPYGENILCIYSSDYSHVPSARIAVKQWYDEIKRYSYGIETVNHDTLHFTQIVWKNTKELGFGMTKNHKGETYIVANYHPRGNIIGQFSSNVLRHKV